MAIDEATSASHSKAKSSRRSRISQEEVPAYSLEQALRVPRAIADGYAYKPTRPLNVAGAMKVSPTSGPFRMLTGAAIAYGLTSGGAFAPEIGITPLGLRIVRPTVQGDDLAAKREALLRPKVIGDFLRQYDGAALPAEAIARNVLLDKGVPHTRLDAVLALILGGAQAVGFITDINGKKYVDLAGAEPFAATSVAETSDSDEVATSGTQAGRRARGPSPALVVSPGIHINVEIHIAADASAETVEEIFKNMRRYVLSGDGAADQD